MQVIDVDSHITAVKGLAAIHYCLGAPLARAEAKITLNIFLDRFSEIRRASTPAIWQLASDSVFGFERLPLLLDRNRGG